MQADPDIFVARCRVQNASPSWRRLRANTHSRIESIFQYLKRLWFFHILFPKNIRKQRRALITAARTQGPFFRKYLVKNNYHNAYRQCNMNFLFFFTRQIWLLMLDTTKYGPSAFHCKISRRICGAALK